MTPKQTGRPARAAVGVALTAAVAAAALSPATPAAAATTLSRTSDATWQTDGPVTDVLVVGSVTYLAGSFGAVRPGGSAPGTDEVPRTRLAAVDTATGTVLQRWAPKANGKVESLAASADGRTIYLGGAFTTVDGQTRKHVAAVSASTGALTAFRADTVGNVKAVAASATRLYLGGSFTSVLGNARTRLAAVELASGALSSWRPAPNDTVLTLALSADASSVYAGGVFTATNGDSTRKRLLKVTAAGTGALQAWSSYPGYPVASVVATPDAVIIGGDGSGGHASRYTTGGTLQWVVQTDGGVNAVAVRDGVVYVGGHFDNVCKGDSAGATTGFRCPENKAPRKKLLAVDAATAALDPWNPGANSTVGVTALDTTTPTLRVGGLFTKLGRVPGGSVLRSQQGYGSFR